MKNASRGNKVLILSTLFAVIAGVAGAASATETQWEKSHPRRDQVNDRLANQHKRIRAEVKEGELTHAQAAKLRKEDRQIRQEERAMASQNGGHITKLEQRVLNQQENGVGKQIGK